MYVLIIPIKWRNIVIINYKIINISCKPFYSLTVTINQAPNATAIPNTGDTEFDSFPVNVTVDAGENFDLEIKCTEYNVCKTKCIAFGNKNVYLRGSA